MGEGRRIHVINYFNPLIGWGSEKGAGMVSKLLRNVLKEIDGKEVPIVFHGTNLGEDHLTPEDLGGEVKKYPPWGLSKALEEVSSEDYVILSQASLIPSLVKRVIKKVPPDHIIIMDQAPFPYRPHQPEGTLRDRISRAIFGLLFRGAPREVKERSLVLLFNMKQADLFRKEGFRRVIHAELPMDSSEVPEPQKNDKSFNIVYMGRIDFDKGPLLLYKTLKHFIKDLSDEDSKKIEVHIIGDGMLHPLLKFLLHRLEKKYGVKIVHHGYMKDERFDILRRSHVLIMPSRMESAVNYSSREAGTAGLHIIHSELPNLAGEERDGLYLVPRKPYQMSEKLREIFYRWREDPSSFEKGRKERSKSWRISNAVSLEKLRDQLRRYVLGI